jgi:hypothetical protein
MTILLRRFVLVLVTLLLGAGAWAAESPRQVWLLSTRGASCCCESDNIADVVRYWRLSDDCGWLSADAKDFHSDTAAVPTVVFIHGNRTDADEAVAKGMHVYQTIRCATGERPFRYVIWSWPADRVGRRNRPDVQLKAAYSDAEACHLAGWLAGLRPQIKVSLIGHSFGPRIIAGALHILAGGEVAGRALPDASVAVWNAKKRGPIRAVMLATADDFTALSPNGRHGLALSQLDEMLVTCNGCDNVLRHYPRLYGRGGPEALGYVGPYGVDAEKVTVVDVSCTVGKTHDYEYYCSASNVFCQWARFTFLDDDSAPQ